MALRSLLRKGPSLAGALRSPPPLPRLGSPSLQALAPAAGARSMSQAAGQTTGGQYGDREHAEFMRNMKILQEQREEFRRLKDEQWAKIHRQLDTVQRVCNVFVILSVANFALQVSLLT